MENNWLSELERSCPSWLRNILSEVKRASIYGMASYSSGAITFGERAEAELGSESWMHTLYPGLPSTVIADIGIDLGLRFAGPEVMRVGLREAIGYSGPIPSVPLQTRTFLKYLNGGRFFGGHLNLYGIRLEYGGDATDNRQPYDLADENIFRRPKAISDDFLIIGGYRWDGSSLCTIVSSMEIMYVDPSGATILNTWSSLEECLSSEFERLSRRFDEAGKLIDPSTPTTPVISTG